MQNWVLKINQQIKQLKNGVRYRYKKRVFDLLSKGDLPPDEIAAKLKINKNTARRYRSDFNRKNRRNKK